MYRQRLTFCCGSLKIRPVKSPMRQYKTQKEIDIISLPIQLITAQFILLVLSLKISANVPCKNTMLFILVARNVDSFPLLRYGFDS